MKAADDTIPAPEWVRVKNALRAVQIGRTTLERLTKSQRVKSRLLKARGNIRGIRLIHLPSLLAFIEGGDAQ